MDTTAHRILKSTRDNLVETFRDIEVDRLDNIDQVDAIDRIIWQLWDLMDNDPSPPDCQECATPIEQPATGRPRRFCSDACRQRFDYYAKTAGQ